jgi:hypothetical protein
VSSSESESDEEDDGLDNRIQKAIKLKLNKLSDDVLAYFRVTLMQKFDAERRRHILVTTPVDIEFEMLCIACGINLLKDFMKKRFRTTLEFDLEALKEKSLPWRLRLALTNRSD